MGCPFSTVFEDLPRGSKLWVLLYIFLYFVEIQLEIIIFFLKNIELNFCLKNSANSQSNKYLTKVENFNYFFFITLNKSK